MSVVEKELLRRLDQWEAAQKSENWPLLTPGEIRDLGIYGGFSGVWVDKKHTSEIAKDGVAVSLLHTGRHYDDDIDETGVLYHYPTTIRPPARDANEVESIKNAKLFGLPIFVIRNVGVRKKLELAWLNDFDDTLRICVLTFHGVDPATNSFVVATPTIVSPPKLFGPRRKTVAEVTRAERDPLFKFRILKRFGGKCIVTSLDVTEMLDAAHIIPVANGGTEDPHNGLLLSASAHRALDAGLWAINPETLTIECKPDGPNALRMKLSNVDLTRSAHLLHPEAIEFRYEKLFLSQMNH